MFRKTRNLQRLKEGLGKEGFDFLAYALAGITRILPHTEVSQWRVSTAGNTAAAWASATRRQLKLTVALHLQDGQTCDFSVGATLQRKMAPTGVGRIARTIDLRERDICERIIDRVSQVLEGQREGQKGESLTAIRTLFDEQIVACHIQQLLRHASARRDGPLYTVDMSSKNPRWASMDRHAVGHLAR